MLPAPSIAALPIQRWILSEVPRVDCWYTTGVALPIV